MLDINHSLFEEGELPSIKRMPFLNSLCKSSRMFRRFAFAFASMVIFDSENNSPLQYEKCFQFGRSTQCMGNTLTFLHETCKRRIRWFELVGIGQAYDHLMNGINWRFQREVDLSKGKLPLQRLCHTAPKGLMSEHCDRAYSRKWPSVRIRGVLTEAYEAVDP